MKKIIAVIPARGGSKSIPKKNIKILGDKPLIAYTIEMAKSVKEIDRVIVSTDTEKIAEIAKKYGAEIPFLRPPELCQDDTPSLPVLQHCVKYLEEQEGYKTDIVVQLFPTSPFLRKETVIKAINLLKNKECNSVVSVEEDYGRFWKLDKLKNKYVVFYPKERINRQYYKPLYKENGAIYFNTYDVVINQNKIVDEESVGFIVMKPNELIDIDTLEDWKNAEDKINKNQKN